MSKQENTGKKRRVRTSLKHPLPDNRASFENHLHIIKAYVIVSKEGKEPVNYTSFKTLVDVNPQIVSGNNKFFVDIGIVKTAEGERGKYIPTKATIKLYNALKWNKEDEIKSLLTGILSTSWFWDITKQLLDVKGTVIREKLREKLGYESGADPKKHNSSLNVIIEYLLFAGLIKEEEGNITYSKHTTIASKKTISREETKTASPSVKAQPVFGVLINPEMSEDQIRKAIKVVYDEWKKLSEKSD